MARLPVIVSFGGYNAAGRSSFHQGYQRIVLDSLLAEKQQETLVGLAVMMQRVRYENGSYISNEGESLSAAEVVAKFGKDIKDNTQIRRIDESYYDVDRVPARENVTIGDSEQKSLTFELAKLHLPDILPEGWEVKELTPRRVQVTITEKAEVSVHSHYASAVQAAAQLPHNFKPEELYSSRFHPKALQLSVLGASDAINSLGIPWEDVMQHVSPEEVSCYASSVGGQLDEGGYGGMVQARLKGGRVSSKQCPMGMLSMPADFVNAYVIGNMGATGSIAGACASFLYNLRAAVDDIQAGRCRVALVGATDAPITPEIMEGFGAMGALATTEKLCRLDNSETTDLHFASRPFGENCGFVMGEGSQYIILMDDQLSLELGAYIHGAVSDVFVNADGLKKSISAPGPGNYISLAKAVASARSLVGDQGVRERSFIQAHGSSTPQNRVTESELLSRVATVFGIEHWPVSAVKAYVGHTLGPASGDQLINSLGVFSQGIMPGITTIDAIAEDVAQAGLSFSNKHRELETPMDIAFLNSKGFGGNNSTASILSPALTEKMLAKRHGTKVIAEWKVKKEKTQELAAEYHQEFLKGNYQIIYKYGVETLEDKNIEISPTSLTVPEFGKSIDLTKENLYKDMV